MKNEKNTQATQNMTFDKRNLRQGEEVLFVFKPDKKSYMRRNIIVGGGIPFPFALLWAVVDFGILFGVPLGTGDYWLWAILIPFMSVHGAPIWIYLYGVVSSAKDYYACGHMITTERFITRTSRKQPFTSIDLSNITSMTILKNKPYSSSLHIDAEKAKALTLYSLHRADVEKAIDIYHDLKQREKNKELNDRYKIKCSRCGGRTSDGHCMYCGSRAELKEKNATAVLEKTEKTTSGRKRK